MNLDKITERQLGNYFRHNEDALWDYYVDFIEQARAYDDRFGYSNAHYFATYWIMDNLGVDITKTSRWLELGLDPIPDTYERVPGFSYDQFD